jgi:hypothetical protein
MRVGGARNFAVSAATNTAKFDVTSDDSNDVN